ncbi:MULTISPECIES: hypothetical protein [Fervidobacterium]|uniref:hypothetical protein n=1 Tax=Fervidobacterium TaxID=2422 RepID=UPI0002E90157|nr:MULTISPECIES: hypothetical protein [Fervidobacterium]HOJ93962.1 hypothetical protein [Fervidobacterium nodosum]
MQKLKKKTQEKILSQYELIKLANLGNEKAQEMLEERLKDTVKKDEKKKQREQNIENKM